MATQQSLPFQVGQLAEAKSFIKGFRGAWFRCKITEITRRKAQIVHALEYYDFPGEKIKYTQIYQKPPKRSSRAKEAKRVLMVRPPFPPVFRESELPDVNTISEVIVVIDRVWRVGDLVDWFADDCYWSGTITEIKGDDVVQIKLPEPPIGEGSSYEASCKDLRPSLDWSPENGWTVPAPSETQDGHACARLIKPVKQGLLPRSLVDVAEEVLVEAPPRSSLGSDESTSSLTSASSLPFLKRSMHSKDLLKQSNDTSKKEMQQTYNADMELDAGGSAVGKPSFSDSVSSTYIRDARPEVQAVTSAEERCQDSVSSKKMRVNETVPLNSTACDSIESTIMDLEELVNRVKWLKHILRFGIPSNSAGPTWKFVEHPPVSTPK